MRRMLVVCALALFAGGVSLVRASEIRVGFTQDALTLDPGNPGVRDTETIIRNMYDGLLTRDSAMRVVPEIAQSWTQPSPTVYEFKLRDGVTFHDGTPLTAADVKFSMERVLSGKIGGQTNPRKDLARHSRPCRGRRSAHRALRDEGALAAPAGDAAFSGDRQRGLREEGRR